jgi:hypothetical protein
MVTRDLAIEQLAHAGAVSVAGAEKRSAAAHGGH